MATSNQQTQTSTHPGLKGIGAGLAIAALFTVLCFVLKNNTVICLIGIVAGIGVGVAVYIRGTRSKPATLQAGQADGLVAPAEGILAIEGNHMAVEGDTIPAARSEEDIQTWLAELTGTESKRHEAVAIAIGNAPTFDPRIVAALKAQARTDPMPYARAAAISALGKISEAHFGEGNEIRAYLERLKDGTLAPIVAATVAAKPIEVMPVPAKPVPLPVGVAAISAAPKPEPQPVPVTPPAPAVPFDQWLLSERNIKLAMYSGGALLLLAGLIFVGVNWNYLAGIVKLGVTLALTAAMYAGGVLMFRRPTLRVGGTALLAIASGFLPLNFVVTQIYITGGMGVSVATMWLVASLACGATYAFTALRTRHNLFTGFLVLAVLSAASAGMELLAWEYGARVLGYALMVLGLYVAGYELDLHVPVRFMALVFRTAVHLLAPLVFVAATGLWIAESVRLYNGGVAWLELGAMVVIVAMYVFDDWLNQSLYARWWAAGGFALLAILVCVQLELGTLPTGFVLKVLAAGYLVLGFVLQRGKALKWGVPLYVMSLLLATLVTVQALVTLDQAPGQLALALVGDVALLLLAAYLFRREEFVFGAAWLALAPVFLYAQLYLPTLTLQALALAVMLLVYYAIAYYFAPRFFRWVLPLLTVAAFLSAAVPAMLYQDPAVMALVLVLIAGLYVAMAVRLKIAWLALPAVAAINVAIVALTIRFVAPDLNLARIVALAFCAWAVALFFARRTVLYLRMNDWAQPLQIGALVNFGLTYGLATLIALRVLSVDGFLTTAFGVTMVFCVALFGLTAYLYHRVELLYGVTWLGIVPVYVFAYLIFGTPLAGALACGALMLGYAGAGYWLAQGQSNPRAINLTNGAFLSPAVGLSVMVVALLSPNYGVMSGVLVVIAAVYTFAAVWLRWRWLVLAGLCAVNLALVFGIMSFLLFPTEIRRTAGIGLAILGVAQVVGGVELKRRGWLKWREPFYLVAALDLLLAYGLAFETSAGVFILLSFVYALIAFAMQWVEREALTRRKLPPVLTYVGAAFTTVGILYGAQNIGWDTAVQAIAIAGGGALFVCVALGIRRIGGEKSDSPFERLFGAPLRFGGYVMLGIGMLLAAAANQNLEAAIVFAIAGVAVLVDGYLRKQVYELYAAGLVLVGGWAWLMRYLQLGEWQAYLVPAGVLALVIGWNELRRGRARGFQAITALGMVLLLVPLFYQSLANVNYALILLVEGIVLGAIGIRMRSRMYVEGAILALAANGLAQFGPAFVNMERWIQIGTVGSVLLLVGLIALFRRQRLLDVRQALTSEWQAWKP